LTRVQKVLERDRAARRRLGAKTISVRKRGGELVYFAPETVTVAKALMARRLNPERAHVLMVLRVAAEVLGIVGTASSGTPPPGTP
jgi:gamma-glutamylcysteine synthetase